MLTVLLHILFIEYKVVKASVYSDLTSDRITYCNSLSNIKFSDQTSIYNAIYDKSDYYLQQKVEKWISNNFEITSSEYFNDLHQFTVPWLIIALACFLLSLLYVIVTLKPIPIIEWLKNHIEEELVKKTKILHKIGMAAIVLLNTLIIVCSIIILTDQKNMISGLEYQQCYMAAAFDDLLNSNNDQFTGYYILENNFNTLTTQFSDFQYQLKQVFSSRQSQTLQNQLDTIIEQNNLIKRGYTTSLLPINISSNGTNSIPSIESYLSQMRVYDYILSSVQDADYLTYLDLYNQVKEIYPDLYLINQIDSMNNYYDSIFESLNSLEISSYLLRNSKLQNIFAKAKAQIHSYNNNLIVYANQYLSFSNNLLNDTKDYIRALNAFLIIIIFFCFLEIVIWILVQVNHSFKFKTSINVIWFLSNLMLIGLLIINIFIHSNSQLSTEFCVYFHNFINDIDIYQSQNIISNNQTKYAIQQCLYGDGNIFQQLNLTSKIKDINQFINSETVFEKEVINQQTQQSSFLIGITNNTQGISMIMDGTIFDLNENQNQQLQSIITIFNSYKDDTGCAEITTTTTCSDGSTPNTMHIYTGSQLCWHPSYLLIKDSATCSQQSSYFQTLKTHFQSQAQSWSKPYHKEFQFNMLNQDLNYQQKSYISLIESFNLEQNTVIQSLNSTLFAQNCSIFKEQFQQMLNGMCLVYYNQLMSISVLTIIVICSLFFSVLFNCLTSLKVSQLDSYEQYASTKVVNLASSERLKGSVDLQSIQQESPNLPDAKVTALQIIHD